MIANSEGFKAERPKIREVPKGQFVKFDTIEQIYAKLFKISITPIQPDRNDARFFKGSYRAGRLFLSIDAQGSASIDQKKD